MMVQLIEQLTSAGGKPKLNELSMPGRTVKSLTHMMGKIKDEAAAIRGGSPKKTASPAGE